MYSTRCQSGERPFIPVPILFREADVTPIFRNNGNPNFPRFLTLHGWQATKYWWTLWFSGKTSVWLLVNQGFYKMQAANDPKYIHLPNAQCYNVMQYYCRHCVGQGFEKFALPEGGDKGDLCRIFREKLWKDLVNYTMKYTCLLFACKETLPVSYHYLTHGFGCINDFSARVGWL